MDLLLYGIAVTASYLLGSVPTAVWAGKVFHGIDVREHGSGNAGAANAVRVLGWKTGIPVLLTDMAKGWMAAMLPVLLKLAEPGTAGLINLQIMTGVVAVIGHIFPLFAGFRGGKGVATVFGVLLALHPLLTLSCLLVFVIVLALTRIISLGSMSAGIAFPVLLFTLFDTPSLIFRIFSVFVAVVLLVTHRNNIKRLIRGEEKKFFGKKE
ncbi:MAG: glycerol-3-phosphate 1-O-acyltransferase PlsY [Bacteroidales bacterium]|nr:glycerol-3-phosphate 1-O-acyltransferase PlsY [Bacteroidales bacterium]MBN2632568.1 glycerol-3-phosphate 1-O-acyltransferase PlsY [Bacteroidales bacterium]